MLGSKNNFFFQSPIILNAKRKDVEDLLFIKGYNEKQIDIYLQAFDYFTVKPKDFDGATGVNDLVDVHGSFGHDGLDLDAMLHDWHYLYFKAGSHFTYKKKVDEIFREGIRRKGKGKANAKNRFKGLLILSPFIIFRSRKIYGKMTATDMFLITKQYNILVNETI
jgi:hypothetical protein